jgi:N-methylhydantoinase B
VSVELAREAYGVVIMPNSFDVDEPATVELRDAIRRARQELPLGSSVWPGTPPTDPGPVGPVNEQLLGEHLGIDSSGWYLCRRCGYRYCSNSVNWKWYAKCDQQPVNRNAIHNSIKERPQGDLVVRLYVCPGCATQVDTEIALITEPPRWNYRPLALRRVAP